MQEADYFTLIAKAKDQSNTEYIRKEDLEEAYRSMGLPETEEKVSNMIAAADAEVAQRKAIAAAEVTVAQRKAAGRPSSRYAGVHWVEERRLWVARITHEGWIHHLGLFAAEEAAAGAVDDATRQLRGGEPR